MDGCCSRRAGPADGAASPDSKDSERMRRGKSVEALILPAVEGKYEHAAIFFLKKISCFFLKEKFAHIFFLKKFCLFFLKEKFAHAFFQGKHFACFFLKKKFAHAFFFKNGGSVSLNVFQR